MKTICLDFDGVLYSYISGWQGPNNLPDDPVPGAQGFCQWLLDEGYQVVINSVRFNEELDLTESTVEKPESYVGNADQAMQTVFKWLMLHRFPPAIKLSIGKPAAQIYIDDRGLRFLGDFNQTQEYMKAIGMDFRPWGQRIT